MCRQQKGVTNVFEASSLKSIWESLSSDIIESVMHSVNYFNPDLTFAKLKEDVQISYTSDLNRPSFYDQIRPYSSSYLAYRRRLSFYILLSLLILGILLLIFITLGSIVLFITYTQRVKTRIAIEKKDICLSLNCSFGSECFFDKDKNDAFCECNNECDNHDKDIVCGSDNVSYSSSCHLQLASCRLQTRIYVKHKGRCGSTLQTDCRTKKCGFGAVCKFNFTKGYECICPSKCSEYDYIGQRLRLSSSTLVSPFSDQNDIICGSDGKDYNNLCHLAKASCSLKKSIQIKFKGKCDPCAGIICPLNQVCIVDDDLNAACSCKQTACLSHSDNKSACGSDGRLYSNLCSLQKHACLSNTNLRQVSTHMCVQGQHPCHRVVCNYSAVCNINEHGEATCLCLFCPKVYKPVCGSDNQTYDSSCHLQREACLLKVNITQAYSGVCVLLKNESTDLSAGYTFEPCIPETCQYGGVCFTKRTADNQYTSICQCPQCTSENDPVCGFNGLSYPNECELRKSSCQEQRPIEVSHKGLCRNCEELKCKYYAICEANFYGIYECVCPQVCLRVDAPVCGSNGVTYDNECELRVRSCKTKININISHVGPCDECQKVSCKSGAYCDNGRCVCPSNCPDYIQEPICANDGITYRNECEMKKTACLNDMDLRPLFYGSCDDSEDDNEFEEAGSGNTESFKVS